MQSYMLRTDGRMQHDSLWSNTCSPSMSPATQYVIFENMLRAEIVVSVGMALPRTLSAYAQR